MQGQQTPKKLVKVASGAGINESGSTVVASGSGIKESVSRLSLRKTPAVSIVLRIQIRDPEPF
jgi:hypothetical protein